MNRDIASWLIKFKKNKYLISNQEIKWSEKLSKKRQSEYVKTRSIVRETLSEFFNIHPLDIPLFAPPGKPPILKSGFGYISLSHCQDALLISWAKNPLGIDIERIDRKFPAKKLLDKFSTENERLILKKLQGENLRLAVLELWTIKEAAIKTNFQDLYHGMNSWEYSFHQKKIFHKLKGNKLNITSFEFLNWKIALATENQLNKKDLFLCF